MTASALNFAILSKFATERAEKSGVGDPDPQDPQNVFETPGSGSFPFLINVLSGLKHCLQNKNKNIKKKNIFLHP
jgi:hypothetical protein